MGYEPHIKNFKGLSLKINRAAVTSAERGKNKKAMSEKEEPMAFDIKRPQATGFAHGLPLILFIDYLVSSERGGQIPSM